MRKKQIQQQLISIFGASLVICFLSPFYDWNLLLGSRLKDLSNVGLVVNMSFKIKSLLWLETEEDIYQDFSYKKSSSQ